MSSSSPVLFENEDWIVVNKPTGISTHGAFVGDTALQEWMQLHLNKKTYVCSRLDKGTSGVIVFAKSPEASGRAQQVHESEASIKEYVLVSASRFKEPQLVVDTPLDGIACETRFTFEKQIGEFYQYRAYIRRGRTHQIRRHAAASGIPILGDSEYGGREAKRLFLHCHKTIWPEILEPLVAPVPLSFDNVANSFRDIFIALERRGSLLLSVTNAMRCVHRGELDFDCAIDLYGQHLCVWDYTSEHAQPKFTPFITQVVKLLQEQLGTKGWVLKRAVKNPHSRRLVVEQKVFGEPPLPWFDVFEHNIVYRISLTESQHVGLFLDQRDNRRMLFLRSGKLRVGNLFSYTCSFSVAAAAGGAEVVFSVDAAKKYLDVGVVNFDINNLSGQRRGKFIAEDVRSWLARQQRKVLRDGTGAKFGALVCDPPTYSSTATQGEFSVAAEWSELAKTCASLLAPQGFAFFSTNHRGGDRASYETELKKWFGVVDRLSQPMDFPVLAGEPEHVKLFLCSQPL